MNDLDIKRIGDKIFIREPLQILNEIWDLTSNSEVGNDFTCEILKEYNPPLMVIQTNIPADNPERDKAINLGYSLLLNNLAENIQKIKLDDCTIE